MKRKKVLIIDDEADFCLLMQFYLSKKNYDVKFCHHLHGGLELIKREKPDVIIADLYIDEHMQNKLKNTIDSIEDYTPDVNLISSEHRPAADRRSLLTVDGESQPGVDEGDLSDEFRKLFRFIRKMFRQLVEVIRKIFKL